MIDIMEVERRLHKYLEPHGWSRMDVGISLMKFGDTHGEDAVQALDRFITWAEEHNQPDMMLATTIGHDLSGCEDALMLPRSSRY